MPATFFSDDIAAVYLPAQALGLTFGTNLFANFIPDAPDSVAGVYELAGPEPMETFGDPTVNPFPAIEIAHIQVVTRDANAITGHTTIQNIWIALRKIVNTTVNGVYYERVHATQSPFYLKRDARRRVYYSCKFQAYRSPTS